MVRHIDFESFQEYFGAHVGFAGGPGLHVADIELVLISLELQIYSLLELTDVSLVGELPHGPEKCGLDFIQLFLDSLLGILCNLYPVISAMSSVVDWIVVFRN